ncbi:MAG: 4-demethylwyosine synthase TYW1 [archaeon]
MNKNFKEILRKQHYALVGNHSAIQVCRWAKKSLIDDGECYKEKFYGIKSHLCCQCSPAVVWCQNKCLHCWRAIEYTLGEKIILELDDPKDIIDKLIEAQRKMLSGFKGNNKINMKKFKDAQNPKHFAISLSGEPTIYSKIGELIKELRKRKLTSFLVTNGLMPNRLMELGKKKQLPTQLYISLNYPNEKIFREITRNKSKQAWKNFNKTLELLPKLRTRKVLRMTLVKDLNMSNTDDYAKLILKASPDFVEVKGFMSVGFARKRLDYERMPNEKEVKEFAKKLSEKLPGYEVLAEKKESRVVLIGKDKCKMKIKPSEI